MSGDGAINGKFTIKSGQGISQAIRDELGLTQEECNKLGKSVWTQIFEQVKAQNEQSKIYDGGSDAWGDFHKNFVVGVNQSIEFSKEIWANIVKLVNDKLGKNIQVAEGGDTPADSSTDSPADTPVDSPPQPPVDSNGKIVTPTTKVSESLASQSKDIASNLKSELKSNWVKQSNVKNELAKFESDSLLAAEVVLQYGEGFAQDIDNVFGMGWGFDKGDFFDKVLTPLIEGAKQYGIEAPNVDKNSDVKTMEEAAQTLAKALSEKEENAQNVFDSSNKLLTDVANMEPKPDVKINKNNKVKTATLEDGRNISVQYDNNGKINYIWISYDLTPEKRSDGSEGDMPEVRYSSAEALYNVIGNGQYDGSITSGYDFNQLCLIAETIFGKWEEE